MYSLTFCVRFCCQNAIRGSPQSSRHSNVENAPVDGQSPASQPRPLPIYGTQFWERPHHPSVTGQQCAQTPPSRPFALCRHIAGWTQACN